MDIVGVGRECAIASAVNCVSETNNTLYVNSLNINKIKLNVCLPYHHPVADKMLTRREPSGMLLETSP